MAKDPVKTPPPARSRAVDLSILTDEDLKAVAAKAAENVAKEKRAAALKLALEKAEEAERIKGDPTEELVNITIDVAEYTDRIVIDGVHYMHGRVYEMPRSKANVVAEVIFRTWGHQAEIDGKKKDFYRKGKNQHITAEGAVVTKAA